MLGYVDDVFVLDFVDFIDFVCKLIFMVFDMDSGLCMMNILVVDIGDVRYGIFCVNVVYCELIGIYISFDFLVR